MLKAKAARHTLTSLHALKIEQTSKRGSQQTGPQPNTTQNTSEHSLLVHNQEPASLGQSPRVHLHGIKSKQAGVTCWLR